MDKPTVLRYPEARLVVFAKAPQAGQVKTRLAAAIGADQAAQAYAGWLASTVRRLVDARLAPVELWVTPSTEHPLFQQLVTDFGVALHAQPAGDLGQRMHRVAGQTLACHEQVVMVGSDCPLMPVDYVERALRAMDQGIDTVIGPAEDGGYVLLGLRQEIPALFADIPWSTDQVMRTTRRRLIGAGCYWAELEPLWDIDSLENYRRWQTSLQKESQHTRPGPDREVSNR